MNRKTVKSTTEGKMVKRHTNIARGLYSNYSCTMKHLNGHIHMSSANVVSLFYPSVMDRRLDCLPSGDYFPQTCACKCAYAVH